MATGEYATLSQFCSTAPPLSCPRSDAAGGDLSCPGAAQADALTKKRSDAVVYAIVTWGSPEPRFLRDLTKTSGGDLFEIESTRDLTAAFTRVFDEFRRRYLVSYPPRGVESGGWHRLQVRVKRPGASVRARPGYRRD